MSRITTSIGHDDIQFDLAVGKDNTFGYFAQVFYTDAHGSEDELILDVDHCQGWTGAIEAIVEYFRTQATSAESHEPLDLSGRAYSALMREVVGV